MSTLTQESVQKLAEAIAPQVYDHISVDDGYIDGFMNAILPAIEKVIGKSSPELVGGLGCAIMGLVGTINVNDPYAEHNIWKTRYEVLHRYVRNTYAESYVDGAEYGIMVPDEIYGY